MLLFRNILKFTVNNSSSIGAQSSFEPFFQNWFCSNRIWKCPFAAVKEIAKSFQKWFTNTQFIKQRYFQKTGLQIHRIQSLYYGHISTNRRKPAQQSRALRSCTPEAVSFWTTLLAVKRGLKIEFRTNFS